jgi:hypothetical protein
MANVNRHIRHAHFTDVDRIQIAVDDFKTAAAADGARQSSARNWFDAELLRSFF